MVSQCCTFHGLSVCLLLLGSIFCHCVLCCKSRRCFLHLCLYPSLLTISVLVCSFQSVLLCWLQLHVKYSNTAWGRLFYRVSLGLWKPIWVKGNELVSGAAWWTQHKEPLFDCCGLLGWPSGVRPFCRSEHSDSMKEMDMLLLTWTRVRSWKINFHVPRFYKRRARVSVYKTKEEKVVWSFSFAIQMSGEWWHKRSFLGQTISCHSR